VSLCLRLTHVVASISPRFDSQWRGYLLSEVGIAPTARIRSAWRTKKKVKLRLGQYNVFIKVRINFGKKALLKALSNNDKAGTIVVKAFATCPTGIEKDKKMA